MVTAQPDRHRAVADAVAEELAERPDVLTVMISGSVARDVHTPASDVDLTVVVCDGAETATSRALRDGILVEVAAFTEEGWLARFDRPKTSWLWHLLDSVVVYDTGPGERLRVAAEATRVQYRTAPELLGRLAVELWHHQGKLDRAARSTDQMEEALSAALSTPTLLDALYAVHDVPLPPGSRRLELLHRVSLSEKERRLVERLLTTDPASRLEAARTLSAHVRTRLGEPDLEQL